jgi:hypothetical protein
MGVHLMGIHLMGVHRLMGVHLMDILWAYITLWAIPDFAHLHSGKGFRLTLILEAIMTASLAEPLSNVIKGAVKYEDS